MEERGQGNPLTERERAARHFNVDASQVTPEMIEQLPPRGTGLETERAETPATCDAELHALKDKMLQDLDRLFEILGSRCPSEPRDKETD
jgi:hypothetical protein